MEFYLAVSVKEDVTQIQDKGSLNNKLAELAPRFRSDLFDLKLHSHPAKGGTISRTLRLRIGQRWPEDGMQKCQVIIERALSQII